MQSAGTLLGWGELFCFSLALIDSELVVISEVEQSTIEAIVDTKFVWANEVISVLADIDTVVHVVLLSELVTEGVSKCKHALPRN